jgi:arylsulfatase A-like enzyme
MMVMTEDNGMPFPRAKITLYDLGTKIPLAIRWPAKLAAGRTVEKLYDVKKDPYQLHNLAQNPDYTVIKEKHAADLEEGLRRTKDPRILGTFEEIFYSPHYENQKKRSQEK